MANIKVKELREVLKQNQKDNIKVADYNGLPIEIKQYIPFLDKITLVSSIYASSVSRENGLHIINRNSMDIAFKINLVQTYSNLTLPQTKNDEGKMETDMIGAYDMLVNSGLYDFIYGNLSQNELLDVQKALNNHIQAKQDEYEQNIQKSSIENTIKEGKDELILAINKFIEKLPEKDEWGNIAKEVSGSINNIDPNTLKFVAQAIGWNNGVEK